MLFFSLRAVVETVLWASLPVRLHEWSHIAVCKGFNIEYALEETTEGYDTQHIVHISTDNSHLTRTLFRIAPFLSSIPIALACFYTSSVIEGRAQYVLIYFGTSFAYFGAPSYLDFIGLQPSALQSGDLFEVLLTSPLLVVGIFFNLLLVVSENLRVVPYLFYCYVLFRFSTSPQFHQLTSRTIGGLPI